MELRERLLPQLSLGRGAVVFLPLICGPFARVQQGGVPAGIWQAPNEEMKPNDGEYYTLKYTVPCALSSLVCEFPDR